MQENELVVLSAFFLTIPLPPLLTGETQDANTVSSSLETMF